MRWILLIIVIGALASNTGADGLRGPWDAPPVTDSKTVSPSQRSYGSQLGISLVRLYQRTASRVDTDRSKSYPVSSLYAIQALDQHGWWRGIFLTADRLIREVDSTSNPRRIYEDGRQYLYDPLERNVWWDTD
nr:membrane protein insertion efficiency factor YidD [Desulfurispira natronophila]